MELTQMRIQPSKNIRIPQDPDLLPAKLIDFFYEVFSTCILIPDSLHISYDVSKAESCLSGYFSRIWIRSHFSIGSDPDPKPLLNMLQPLNFWSFLDPEFKFNIYKKKYLDRRRRTFYSPQFCLKSSNKCI